MKQRVKTPIYKCIKEEGRQEREAEILEIINNLPCYPAKEVKTGDIEPFIIVSQLIKQIKEAEK